MEVDEALNILTRLKNWQQGADKRVIIEAGITKKQIAEALEYAISKLENLS